VLALRIGLTFTGLLLAVTAVLAADPEIPGPSLGVAIFGTSVPDALVAEDKDHPIEARLVVDWSAIESVPGAYDWSSVEPALATLASRGARVSLCVRGESPLHAHGVGDGDVPDGAWLQAWTALLRSAVATFSSRIAVVEVGERPDLSFDAVSYAFVLKSSSLAIKAEAKARGIAVRVAQGSVGSDGLAWQKTLWENDSAPYIDVLPVNFGPGADVAAGATAFAAEAVLHPPAAELRVQVAADEADSWSSFRGALRAFGSSAPSAFVTLPIDAGNAETVARVVARLQARLAQDYAPAPVGGLALRTPAGGVTEGAAVLGRFLHAKDLATLVVYQAPPGGAPEAQSRLLLDTIDVKDPAVLDLLSGESFKTGPASVPGESARALRMLVADHPMAATWDRAAVNQPGLDVASEDVQVATTRSLTAEEIIARNRQVQNIQDDRLLRWIAKGRADIHFKLAEGGGSIDVGIESSYFWRRGAALEWQQARYYVNGNLVTWKKIPELPLIQPEKVLTLPLDLTFDKTYDYTLIGEDTQQGRPAYIVGFEPVEALAGQSLYRGRVWIDKESFVRLRTSVIQTNLEPPVLQNEETDTYVPVTGPDGATYILIGRIDGQQLWSGWGRNFVVRRELALTGFELNMPEEEFDGSLKAAYASDDQMLRDTDKGFRYLKTQPDGERVVQETVKTDALFALAGALKDDSTSGVVPLLGVNWFDTNFLKKDLQFNVFFAGVFAYVNLTDPSIRGSKVDLGVEASLVGLKLDDQFYVNGVEDVSQRVLRRSQFLTGRFGYPLGEFFKVSAIGDIAWNAYEESSDAKDALAEFNAANGTDYSFVVPPDDRVYSGTLRFQFNRMGYSLTASGTASRRSEWNPWGLYDNQTATFVDPSFDSAQQSFQTWSLVAFKEWYLPKFQKLKAELGYLDGGNLDRFSQYGFARFGAESLAGYAGTGLRFDTGYLARTGWAFNILNVVRFDVSAEFAHIKDSLKDDRFQNFSGLGLSFNVVGPWKTIWQGSYGRAITADVPELEGTQEFELVVLKLF
jgi:hypothetical protein